MKKLTEKIKPIAAWSTISVKSFWRGSNAVYGGQIWGTNTHWAWNKRMKES